MTSEKMDFRTSALSPPQGNPKAILEGKAQERNRNRSADKGCSSIDTPNQLKQVI